MLLDALRSYMQSRCNDNLLIERMLREFEWFVDIARKDHELHILRSQNVGRKDLLKTLQTVFPHTQKIRVVAYGSFVKDKSTNQEESTAYLAANDLLIGDSVSDLLGFPRGKDSMEWDDASNEIDTLLCTAASEVFPLLGEYKVGDYSALAHIVMNWSILLCFRIKALIDKDEVRAAQLLRIIEWSKKVFILGTLKKDPAQWLVVTA